MMICEASTKPKTVRSTFIKECVLPALSLIPFYFSLFCSIFVLFMDPLVCTMSSSLNPYNTHTSALSRIVSTDNIYDGELSFRIHSYLRNPAWKFYFGVNDKRGLGKMNPMTKGAWVNAFPEGINVTRKRDLRRQIWETLSVSTFWKITPNFPSLFVCLSWKMRLSLRWVRTSHNN